MTKLLPKPSPLPDGLAQRSASRQTSAAAPRLDSQVLFAGGSELVIFHYGESYRLRETRQGKLILTK